MGQPFTYKTNSSPNKANEKENVWGAEGIKVCWTVVQCSEPKHSAQDWNKNACCSLSSAGLAPPNEVSTVPHCRGPTRCPPSQEDLKTIAPNVSRRGKWGQTTPRRFASLPWNESLKSSNFQRPGKGDPNAEGQCNQDRGANFAIFVASCLWGSASPGLWNLRSLSATLGFCLFLRLTVGVAKGRRGQSHSDRTGLCLQERSERLKLCWRHHSFYALLEHSCLWKMSSWADLQYSWGSWFCPLLWKLVQQ